VVATVNIISPPSGSTSTTAIVEFQYSITDTTLGVSSIEYSLDGVNFTSVFEGLDNKNLAQSDYFPFSGPDAKFYIKFTQGLHTLYFRAVDCTPPYPPAPIPVSAPFTINIDIGTSITFNPIPVSLTNDSGLIVGGDIEPGATAVVTIGLNSFPVTYPTFSTWQSTVTLQEGTNIIIAVATDPSLNTATATATVILDTIVPGVPVVKTINPASPDYYNIGSPPLFTNMPVETLAGDKEANTSIWVNGVLTIPLNVSTTFSFPYTLSEGDNAIHIAAKDLVGNTSAEAIVNINLDTVPPINPEIIINDSVAYTLRRNVTLKLSADNAVAVKVSENPIFPNVEYISFPTSPLYLPFELSRGGGTKIVYAVFKDAVGNESDIVFDSIILPSTISHEAGRAPLMTITPPLFVTPDSIEYIIRMQDNRDGTFSVELYWTLIDALTQTNLKGHVSPAPTLEGEQIGTVVADVIGGPTGTITFTTVRGGEMMIYRYRTDVYEADTGESLDPVSYIIRDVGDAYIAQTLVPVYEGSAFGQITEANVSGNMAKVRITKAFGFYGTGTAIVGTDAYPIVDVDGEQYPITGAKFDYPLLTVPVEVIDIIDEGTDYLLTLDTPLPRFDSTFGFEMLFSRRRDWVTDYRITKGGRVEFLDESGLASGNVRVTYMTPQSIYSIPSSEFKQIVATPGSTVKLIVQPTNNRILLSDLANVCVRFFHSLVNVNYAGPSSVKVTVNSTHSTIITSYAVVDKNSRAEVRTFCASSQDLFPGGLPDTYGPSNPVLDNVEIEFITNANITYTDELEVIAKSSIVGSNCRILINGVEQFISSDPVSSHFDTHEIRVQDGHVDVTYNDKLVHSEDMSLGSATASFGAGSRMEGDSLNAAFKDFTTIQYIDSTPTSLSLTGRYIEVETNLRENSKPLLKSFEFDFASPESEYPIRYYTPTILEGEFTDTSTVAIIGMGHREEVLVSQGAGEEDEGQPVDFQVGNLPDGKHFQVTSFPITSGTLEITLRHDNVDVQLVEGLNYSVNLEFGYIVLFHPIALNDRLSVVYSSDADTNIPELFLNIDSLVAKFGTPSIENTLSLGASLAFANGARRVLAVQAFSPTVDPGWSKAYTALSKEEAYFVVPIPPSNYASVAASGLAHVENQSATKYRHERVLILGETSDLIENDLSIFRKSFRVTYLQPNELLQTVIKGETESLDGRYLAAIYAGKFSSLSYIAEPMTGKILTGFDINWQPRITNIELEQKVSKGITFIKTLASGGQVYRGVTTVNSGLAVEEEPSIVRIRDFLAINIRKTLEDQYIGQPIVGDILQSIEGTTSLFLNSQKTARIISRFDNLRVKIDSVEPRQVNVTFDVQPIYPLNTVMITVRVVVSL